MPLRFSRWLTQLRFGLALTMLGLLAAAQFGLGMPLPLRPMAAVLGLLLLFNLFLVLLPTGPFSEHPLYLASQLVVDNIALTALLYFSGGPMNPFSTLFIVQVALAAVVLPWTWAAGVSASALAGFATLFIDHRPMVLDHHGSVNHHLQGMWLAFLLSSVLVTVFIQRIRRALELAQAQHRQRDTLAMQAWLAADAAHRLATPLNNVLLASEALPANDGPEQWPQAVLRSELARCQDILSDMQWRAGQTVGESSQQLRIGPWLDEIAQRFRNSGRKVRIQAGAERWAGPKLAVEKVLEELLQNACDAGAANIVLSGEVSTANLELRVDDDGDGLGTHPAFELTQPFFSTKNKEQHQGLGLYLAKVACEELGGSFDIASGVRGGAQATLRLPIQSQPRSA